MIRAVIKGTGSYLPERIVTNADLEKMVDTTDEWIVKRTGIRERHIARDDESTSDMAIEAGRKALEMAGVSGRDIDGIIVGTSTPDKTFPSVAVHVQEALDIPAGPMFDVQAVCSGFVYAMSMANLMLTNRQAKRILVIGAERMSSVMDWNDRTTCVLFGDGAGAVVLEADEGGTGALADRGIISTHLYADGRHKDILNTTGGTSTTQTAGLVYMEGREVFRHAVQYMADVVNETLEANQITGADIDWLVPHQANVRIIEGTAKKLGMSMDKVVLTVDKHGNTSAASIPLALDTAVREGKIKQGDMLLMEALGAGLTWGSVLVRF